MGVQAVRCLCKVCTRADLLSEVWGYSFDPGTNVVDVCVRRLRAKVGAERIETIRNVGYAFQASSALHPGLGLAAPDANGNGDHPDSWGARLAAKVDGRSASYAMIAAAKASTPISSLYAVWLP